MKIVKIVKIMKGMKAQIRHTGKTPHPKAGGRKGEAFFGHAQVA